MLQVKRADRDIEKVLERYLFQLATHYEKLQQSLFIAETSYVQLPDDRNSKTLKIFLPDRSSRLSHTFLLAKSVRLATEGACGDLKVIQDFRRPLLP